MDPITAGVVSSFIYSSLAAAVRPAVRNLLPGLFYGGSTPLKQADLAFARARDEILKRYPKDETVNLFLSPEKTIKGGVLNPLFEHIFLGVPNRSRKIDQAFLQCANSYYDKAKASQIVDEIIDSVQRHLLGQKDTASYALYSKIAETQDILKNLSLLIDSAIKESKLIVSESEKSAIYSFSREYNEDLREIISQTTITGLDYITKREQIVHPLSDAYVALSIERLSEVPMKDNFDDFRVDAMDTIREIPKLIIRGPAGSGKTTLLQWVIWKCSPFEGDNSDPSLLPYFPIYIPLRRLEAHGAQEFRVKNVIHEMLPNWLKNRMPPNWPRALYERDVELIFLVDGIDEVSELKRPYIWTFLKGLNESYPNARILVTSRNVAAVHLSDGTYRSEIFQDATKLSEARRLWAKPDDFFEFVVAPLSNLDIATLIDKWYSSVDTNELKGHEQSSPGYYAERLKDEVFSANNIDTLHIMRTPLLSSLVCLVFLLQRGALPKSRRHLYEYSTELLVLVRDEFRKVNSGPEFASFTLQRRLGLLKHIALIMQEGAGSVTADQAIEVSRTSVVNWIAAWKTNHLDMNLPADEYLKYLIERSSLLREPSAGRVDFIHRSFMEYLAADQIALTRQPYQIREKIQLDEWQNTLQFCMSTKSGNVFFAGQIINTMFEFVTESTMNEKSARKLRLRILGLVGFLETVSDSIVNILNVVAPLLLPPKEESEIPDLVNIPVQVLEKFIKYDQVSSSADQLAFCLDLLCRHEDVSAKRILLTGYQNINEIISIKRINQSGKLSVTEHTALQKRILNHSYTEPVYLTAAEMRDRDLRATQVREVWLKFPIIGLEFVGWDYIYRCSSVRFLGVSSRDIDILLRSMSVKRFDSCKNLKIEYGYDVNLSHISSLFPALESLEMEKCTHFSLSGLQDNTKLKEVWITGCSQRLVLSDKFIGPNLTSVVFYRSISPETDGNFSNCEIIIEKDSRDIALKQRR